MQRLRKKAKIDYAQNAARHSFASYHVASHQDGTKTAHMLGHPDPQLLYSNYRKLVRREDATRYWNIVPKSVKAEREAEKNGAMSRRARTPNYRAIVGKRLMMKMAIGFRHE